MSKYPFRFSLSNGLTSTTSFKVRLLLIVDLINYLTSQKGYHFYQVKRIEKVFLKCFLGKKAESVSPSKTAHPF